MNRHPTSPPTDSESSDQKRGDALDSCIVATDSTSSGAPRSRLASPRVRWALISSLIVHLILLVVLLFWYLPHREATKQANRQALQQTGASEATQSGSAAGKNLPPELMVDREADDVPDDQLRKSIQSQIESVKKLPDQVKLSQLEKNLKRLKSIANEKSVDQITTRVGSTLGLDTQQYQPKPEVTEGRFDFDTAQLSDVTRRKGTDGQWIYEATLVDKDGRQNKVEMSTADGETMHEMFAKMKQYPMAAGIYRSVVMPMLQKIIEAQRTTKKLAREADQIEAKKKQPR